MWELVLHPELLAHLLEVDLYTYISCLPMCTAPQNISMYVCRYLICDYPADIYANKSGIHKHLCLPVTKNLVLSELNAILVKNIASCRTSAMCI